MTFRQPELASAPDDHSNHNINSSQFRNFQFKTVDITYFIHRTLNKLVVKKEDNWDDYLDGAVCANNSMKSTVHFT